MNPLNCLPFKKRSDTHKQMLVDVGIVLHKAYGSDYAGKFMEEMRVPPSVILRVVQADSLRRMMHLPILMPGA